MASPYINQINGTQIQAVYANDAGFASNALTASYALTAETLLGSVTSASYALSSSYARTASYALGALQAVSASSIKVADNTSTNFNYFLTFASQTSGHAELGVDSSTLTWNPSTNTLTAQNFAGNATTATNAQSATSASYALTASYATIALNTSMATSASYAVNSTTAATASYVQNAITASRAILAVSASTNLITANSTYYIPFVPLNPGSELFQALGINGAISFNPSTNTLSTTRLSVSQITGSTLFTGSMIITGSVNGNVISASIASATASLDLNLGNFFFIQLTNGSNLNINPINIKPGQTVNIRIQQAAGSAGGVTWPPTVKQPSGSIYVPTTALSAYDIVSLVSFDTSNLYLSYVKRLI